MKHHPFEEYFKENPINLPKEAIFISKEKVSQKEIDIFCRKLLENQPELKRAIIAQMENLKKENLPMPVVHISTKAIKNNNGEISTGFIENIKEKGFRKRDTNISAFIRKAEKNSLAKPEFLKDKPEEFIKSLRLFLQRYLHHGLRTNKEALKELKGSSEAVPAMILIDGDVQLEHGSDYDDHYILKNGSTPEQIIGIIDLEKHNRPRSEEDITYIAKIILEMINSYYRFGQKLKN